MRRGPLQIEDGRDDQSTYFVRCNAGKESLALDLAHPAARPVVHDLARRADVAIENFVPGVVAKLGCDYETLSALKPDLVYCSISGYGQTGPWKSRPAFAHLINAASGMMYLEQGDDPAPRPANLQAADVLAGTHAFGAIMAALWRRARTGRGRADRRVDARVPGRRRRRVLSERAQRRARARRAAHRHVRQGARRPLRRGPDRRRRGDLAAPDRADGAAGAARDPRFCHDGRAPGELARAARDLRQVARPLRHRRRGGRDADRRAGALRPRAVAGGDRRAPAPGGARVLPPGAASRARAGPRQSSPFHLDGRPASPAARRRTRWASTRGRCCPACSAIPTRGSTSSWPRARPPRPRESATRRTSHQEDTDGSV